MASSMLGTTRGSMAVVETPALRSKGLACCRAQLLQARRCSAISASRPRAWHCATVGCSPRRCAVLVLAEKNSGSSSLQEVIKTAGGAVDTASSWVPESVPRPLAKAGVVGVGALLLLWLVKSVVSTVLTIGLLGGGLYLWYRSSAGGDNDIGGGSSSSGRSKAADDADDGDALSKARRIMDKYK